MRHNPFIGDKEEKENSVNSFPPMRTVIKMIQKSQNDPWGLATQISHY